MILYLSSAIKDERFAEYIMEGKVSSGHQAQKFNSTVIKGLSQFTYIEAVSNPPYTNKGANTPRVEDISEQIHYVCLGSNRSKIHKVSNFIEMYKYAKKVCKNNLDAIICDAINPLASLTAIILRKTNHIPAIAIITDIPEYMDAGNETFFTKLTSRLMKKYDGYVFLTEAMNPLVNLSGRPYLIMEGLCDAFEKPEAGSLTKKTDDYFICVYTGSLSQGTGIEELVDAFCKLKNQRVQLHIYGNGILAEKIQQISKTFPAIQYKGIVSNREAISAQKRADLLINPRPANIAYGNFSFPSKVMEYMASGTPVLTTKLPGIPEEYFDYLYTIDECSTEGITRAILEIFSLPTNKRIEKGKEAQNYVMNKKNNVIQAKRILNLLESIP